MTCPCAAGRRRAVRVWLALALGVALAAGGVRAASPINDDRAASGLVEIRAISHQGSGRIVFTLPADLRPTVSSGPGWVRVRVPGGILQVSGPMPTGLRSINVTGDTALLVLRPGSVPRVVTGRGAIVVDAPPSARPRPVTVATTAKPAATSDSRPAAGDAAPPGKVPAAPPPPAEAAPRERPAGYAATANVPVTALASRSAPATEQPHPAPATEHDMATVPESLAATLEHAPDGSERLVLPFLPGTGVASFRLRDAGLAVFDEARPIDLGAIRDDKVFAAATVRLLPASTLLSMPLRPGQVLLPRRRAQGWALEIGAIPPAAAVIKAIPAGLSIDMSPQRPLHVIALADPASGAQILAGTVTGALGDPPNSLAAGVAVGRRNPTFALLASTEGVGLEPLADDVVLRTEAGAFVVESARHAGAAHVAGGSERFADASAFSRRFDMPASPVADLDHRLQAALLHAASLPARDRGPARLDVAEAMLSLGMGAEAEGETQLAVREDGRLAGSPRAKALEGAAALLAGRLADAAVLDDKLLAGPDQPGHDEIMLWRALREAALLAPEEQPSPAAAQVLAAKWPLLAAYPAPVRDRLLPLAVETMVRGGAAEVAREVAARQPDDMRLELARALLDEQAGRPGDALKRLDRLAQSPDRDLRARAAGHAVSLRLSQHLLSPDAAADALAALIPAWRGDVRELALRVREAELRAGAGHYRAALALLRAAAQPPLAESWPDRAAALQADLRRVFAQALAADAKQPMPPFDYVTLVRDNADLLPVEAEGRAVAERVADRLATLDLPDEAADALQHLSDATPPGLARAALGGRLAALRLEQGDANGAMLALSASVADGLPADLAESRTMTFARAAAARGEVAAAVGALSALSAPAPTRLRAQLQEQEGLWAEAAQSWRAAVEASMPVSGPVNPESTDLLLRWAAAAARAGDTDALAVVAEKYLPRVPAGSAADSLGLLVASPVRGVSDLPRAGREAALARSVIH